MLQQLCLWSWWSCAIETACCKDDLENEIASRYEHSGGVSSGIIKQDIAFSCCTFPLPLHYVHFLHTLPWFWYSRRFSTRPSVGLEDDEDVSGQNSRKLMAERASVVALFKAEKLWKEGFRGELVKMGVFDTGIRLDHPHVKNIRQMTHLPHDPWPCMSCNSDIMVQS